MGSFRRKTTQTRILQGKIVVGFPLSGSNLEDVRPRNGKQPLSLPAQRPASAVCNRMFIYESMYVYIYIYICVLCLYYYVYIYIYIYVYIYTHIWKSGPGPWSFELQTWVPSTNADWLWVPACLEACRVSPILYCTIIWYDVISCIYIYIYIYTHIHIYICV